MLALYMNCVAPILNNNFFILERNINEKTLFYLTKNRINNI